MTDKEQIIINGINIFDTLDEWADLISQNWCSAEYLTAEIIKNHILGINKQLARKTQKYEALTNTNRIHAEIIEELNNKYNDLKEDYKELEQRHNGAFQDLERLKQECEQKQKIIEELKKQLETSEKWRIKAESLNEKLNLENTCYRKALEEIEEYVKTTIRMPLEHKVILNIIGNTKEENNGINDNSK